MILSIDLILLKSVLSGSFRLSLYRTALQSNCPPLSHWRTLLCLGATPSLCTGLRRSTRACLGLSSVHQPPAETQAFEGPHGNSNIFKKLLAFG